ncbi:transcriptional regulator with XRE-family HTH domain [Caldicoprobacter guelmensis]|uniref:helix-turn-helix domain-containing protein n=1 Tax=Caldicoprobacter guelmensis TaxID=1170224 RepID=UPI001959E9D1|nr:helix-turn-helix transcriptional regulator [Caldicoprobacter guelmensis]MBM7582479.1 transcriptional regulator with XRE-family HTH domain [Caldicoprobacter guelmensis]
MFSKRLKELRKEHKMTQTELGKILGLSTSAIGMYEQGRRDPDSFTLQKIADTFNVTVDYLLGRSDIRNPYTCINNKNSEKDNKKYYYIIADENEFISVKELCEFISKNKKKR